MAPYEKSTFWEWLAIYFHHSAYTLHLLQLERVSCFTGPHAELHALANYSKDTQIFHQIGPGFLGVRKGRIRYSQSKYILLSLKEREQTT